MTDVPSSDWGNGLWLVTQNVPELSASYRKRIPRTSRTQLLHIRAHIVNPFAHQFARLFIAPL